MQQFFISCVLAFSLMVNVYHIWFKAKKRKLTSDEKYKLFFDMWQHGYPNKLEIVAYIILAEKIMMNDNMLEAYKDYYNETVTLRKLQENLNLENGLGQPSQQEKN